jgi:hypothetical protein
MSGKVIYLIVDVLLILVPILLIVGWTRARGEIRKQKLARLSLFLLTLSWTLIALPTITGSLSITEALIGDALGTRRAVTIVVNWTICLAAIVPTLFARPARKYIWGSSSVLVLLWFWVAAVSSSI